MGIRPSEFWEMTYAELLVYTQGFASRRFLEQHFDAHLASAVMASSGWAMAKRPPQVSADELLGLPKPRSQQIRNEHDAAALRAKMKETQAKAEEQLMRRLEQDRLKRAAERKKGM